MYDVNGEDTACRGDQRDLAERCGEGGEELLCELSSCLVGVA